MSKEIIYEHRYICQTLLNEKWHLLEVQHMIKSNICAKSTFYVNFSLKEWNPCKERYEHQDTLDTLLKLNFTIEISSGF